jgi:hypothetical protein
MTASLTETQELLEQIQASSPGPSFGEMNNLPPCSGRA